MNQNEEIKKYSPNGRKSSTKTRKGDEWQVEGGEWEENKEQMNKEQTNKELMIE